MPRFLGAPQDAPLISLAASARPSTADPSTEEVDAVASAPGTSFDSGLTAQEATRRLAIEGPNELRPGYF
ncbi:MAG: cation-transporting P-type ATPase [Pseudomonadota bacterium]